MWEPTRDFAFAKLPSGLKGIPTICALSSHLLYVVTGDGNFFQYQMDANNGGECSLFKQYSLQEAEEDAAGFYDGISSST